MPTQGQKIFLIVFTSVFIGIDLYVITGGNYGHFAEVMVGILSGLIWLLFGIKIFKVRWKSRKNVSGPIYAVRGWELMGGLTGLYNGNWDNGFLHAQCFRHRAPAYD